MKSANEMMPTQGGHAEWIPLIDTATKEVFELMLGCKLAPPTGEDKSDLDVTAMVGLAGQLCGVLSVRCDGKAATLMASKMLGVELNKVSDGEVSDAIGEVSNMVAGNFKNKIAGLAEGCMLSPPTVITGSDYDLHPMADLPTLEVRAMFENMQIVISLQIHS